MPTFIKRDPLAILKERSRRLVVCPPDETGVRLVYAITHANSPELVAMAAIDTSGVIEAMLVGERTKRRLESAKTDEERERITREASEAAEELGKKLVKDMFGTQEKEAAYINRCRAVVCQAVQAVGIAREDADTGVQSIGTRDLEVCEPLGEDEQGIFYLRPLKMVMDAADDEKKGIMSILKLGDGEVYELQRLFVSAFEVKGMVEPLSGESRAAEVGGRSGQEVRAAPERVRDGSGPSGSGNRRSRRTSGKG